MLTWPKYPLKVLPSFFPLPTFSTLFCTLFFSQIYKASTQMPQISNPSQISQIYKSDGCGGGGVFVSWIEAWERLREKELDKNEERGERFRLSDRLDSVERCCKFSVSHFLFLFFLYINSNFTWIYCINGKNYHTHGL